MLKYLSVIACAFLFLSDFSDVEAADHDTTALKTASGYQSEGWVYAARGAEKPTGIVFLHGKAGSPDSPHSAKFIAKMRDLGYKVIAPVMPWAKSRGYDGAQQNGMGIISAAAKALGKPRVVIIGHSMGAAAALQYGAEGVTKQVKGLVLVATGHLPQHSRKIRRATAEAAEEACARVAAGKGKQRNDYPDVINGKRATINATAAYYCSYFHTDQYPDVHAIAMDVKTPAFIIGGNHDRLTQIYSFSDLFQALPDNEKHNYAVLPGKHKTVLHNDDTVDAIDAWISDL